jgi:hypothetical protein
MGALRSRSALPATGLTPADPLNADRSGSTYRPALPHANRPWASGLNKQKEVVTSRDDEIAALRKREEAHVNREEDLLARIKEVENALRVSKLISNSVEKLMELTQLAHEERVFARAERAELRQSIAEVQESAKTLGDMLSAEEERAAKRARA